MSHDAAGAYKPHRGWSQRVVFNAYASVQRPVLETSAAKMESTNPTPPPLVHNGASSSRSVPDQPAACTRDGDDSAGSGGIELAQFQKMLVRVMRDPRVRSAVFPGPTTHDSKYTWRLPTFRPGPGVWVVSLVPHFFCHLHASSYIPQQKCIL